MKKSFTSLLFALCCLAASAQSGTWVPQAEGLLTNDDYTLDIVPVSEEVVWALFDRYASVGSSPDGVGGTILRTTDGGENWEATSISGMTGDFAVSLSAVNAETAWVTVADLTARRRRIYRTTDGGATWQQQLSITPGTPSAVFAPLVKFKNEQEGYYLDLYGRRTARTSNGGATWTANTFSIIGGGQWSFTVPNSQNWWEVKGDSIWWGASNFIRRSTDGGTSWQQNFLGLPGQNIIQAIQFAPSGLGLAISDSQTTVPGQLAIGQTIVLRSTNYGATWVRLPNLPFPISTLTYVPGTEQTFIGTSGVWYASGEQLGQYASAYTTDGGETWEVIDRAIPRNTLGFFSPSVGWAGRMEGYDYGGEAVPALFKWEGDLLTSTVNVAAPEYKLRAWPNPFADEILLEFDLPSRDGLVEITVSDLLGRQLQVFRPTHLDVGLNQLPLRIDTPAGVLFITLQQGTQVRTVKVVKQSG